MNFNFNILILCTIIFLFIFGTRLAKYYPIKDIPGRRKIHKTPVSLMGGAYIFLYLFFFVIFFYLFSDFDLFLNKTLFFSLKDFIFFSIILILFLFIGLVDDKFQISSFKKIFIYFFLIYLLVNQSSNIQISKIIISNFSITLGSTSIFFTSGLILMMLISSHLYDGINLQSTSFYLIIYILLSYLLSSKIIFFLLVPPLILFSILNYQNKSFLGEAGVNALSLIASILFIKTYNYGLIKIDFIFLILIFIIPLLDASRLFMIRSIKFGNPFRSDKNHLHHLLLRKYGLQNSLLILNLPIIIFIYGYFYSINFIYLLFIILIYFLLLLVLLKKK